MRCIIAGLVVVLLGASPARAADGGVSGPSSFQLPRGAYMARAVTIELPDGGVLDVASNTVTGCWLDEGSCVRIAQERVALQERARLAEAAQVQPDPSLLTVVFLTGTALGVLTMAALYAFLPKPTQPVP